MDKKEKLDLAKSSLQKWNEIQLNLQNIRVLQGEKCGYCKMNFHCVGCTVWEVCQEEKQGRRQCLYHINLALDEITLITEVMIKDIQNMEGGK